MIFTFSPLDVVAKVVHFIKNYLLVLLGFVVLGICIVILANCVPSLVGATTVKILGALAIFISLVEFVLAAVDNRSFNWQKVVAMYCSYLLLVIGALLVLFPLAFGLLWLLCIYLLEIFQPQHQYIVFMGILACVVGGVWIMLRVSFTPILVGDENINSMKALKKSWQITKGTIPAQVVTGITAGLVMVLFIFLVTLVILGLIALARLMGGNNFLLLKNNMPVLLDGLVSPIGWVYNALLFSHIYLAIRKNK